MIKAILLDLDNTLLNNPQDVFVREYLRVVDDYFEQRWQTTVSGALLKSMTPLMKVRDLHDSNTALVVRMVEQAVYRTQSEIRAAFAEFYATVYPTLQRFAQPFPYVAELISQLRAEGFALVIATNPVYPAEAIQQRLGWAGLSDKLEDYAFVTHGDNMHYIKPDPAYYGEILARVGIEPDEAFMIGDSLESDIMPAVATGLHTYHVKTTQDSEGSGTLADLYALICGDNWTDSLPVRRLAPNMIQPEMRGSLGALYGLLAEVKPHYWHQHPDPHEWSIMQILCHLLESEQTVQRPRLERILSEENPFLGVPRKPPGPEFEPCSDDGYAVARAFVQERQTTLELLRKVSPEAWLRPARHSVFGPTSLLEMAHFTAQHDRLHLNQFCRTLGKCE